jgi:putative transcriptional regulator
MDLNIDFFEIKNDRVASKGLVLISEPFLSDSYFKRSVVFLTEHSDEGSVGFVLNKPVELKLQEVMADFPPFDAVISIGGPVNTNTVHYLHTLGDKIPESVPVKDNIYWGGSFDVIKELIEAGEISNKDIRFFLGYSGWSPKQLEDELSENAWLIADLNNDLIMNGVDAGIWVDILKKMKNKYKVWANFPENPGMN